MSNLNRIKVVDFTMGRRSSDDVNTDIPFSDNFEKTRTIQQANVVLGAYVNRNYKDNRQWLTELENKADIDDIPTKTSDLTNDGSDSINPFITNQVNDLANYTNNTDLSTLLDAKASNSDLNNVKSAIDYKSPNYMGDVIVESIRSKNMLSLFNNTITKSNASYDINNGNSINVTSTGEWAFALVENFVVTPNTNYVFSCNLSNNQSVNAGIIIYDNNDNTLNFQNTTNQSDTLEIPFNSPTSTVKIKFACNNTSEYHNNDTTYYDIQVEKGSVVTSFSPYQNLNLIPYQYTGFTLNSTYVLGTGFSHCYIIGNLVIMTINIELANNIPNASVLISGLPKSLATQVPFSGIRGLDTGTRLYLIGDKIYNDGVLTSGGWLNAQLIYTI